MKNKVISVFRKDFSNVGDWWSSPHLYFPLYPQKILDLTELPNDVSPHDGLVIVGGGGLGRDNFRVHLNRLRSIYPNGKLIGWGVGADLSEFNSDRESLPSGLDLLGDYFEHFDLVKSRVWTPDQTEQWLPCVSAMHTTFDKLHQKTPDVDVVVYSHKRRKIQPKAVNNFWKKNREFISIPRSLSILHADNDGNDLAAKLSTLARARVVITNSYHGVYWATLLGKKTICLPFKSGLFSFKHRPMYRREAITLDDLQMSPAYPSALEECRKANTLFYEALQRLYS